MVGFAALYPPYDQQHTKNCRAVERSETYPTISSTQRIVGRVERSETTLRSPVHKEL